MRTCIAGYTAIPPANPRLKSARGFIFSGEPPRIRRSQIRHRGGGFGEPGLPPFAPTLATALFAPAGRRLRTLPLMATVAQNRSKAATISCPRTFTAWPGDLAAGCRAIRRSTYYAIAGFSVRILPLRGFLSPSRLCLLPVSAEPRGVPPRGSFIREAGGPTTLSRTAGGHPPLTWDRGRVSRRFRDINS
jgi:hypothetical protein